MRQIIFTTFMKASRLFAGRGLGKRLPFIGLFYTFLFRRLKPAQDIVMVDVRGIKMCADFSRRALGPGSIHGYYEKGETELFKSIVKEGMTVVDIGANIGYYTLIAAKLVGEKGKVFSFEPGPDNYGLLLKNPNQVSKIINAGCQTEDCLLDVAILSDIVFKLVLGIGKLKMHKDILYVESTIDALKKVDKGEAKLAFLVNPVDPKIVWKIAQKKLRLPEKSTDFYPKPCSGLMMMDISNDEKL